LWLLFAPRYTPNPDFACHFYFGGDMGGYQRAYITGGHYYTSAVHDVSIVAPALSPGTILLPAPGLAGLLAIRRRFKGYTY
jgi:hypothetical protein